MNTQQAYEWVKSFKLSSIRNIGLLQTMTIRKLKAVASKMNNELGLVIIKAMFGKTYSSMKKAELIDAIWFVRSVQMAAPKGEFDLKRLTSRIFAYVVDARTQDERAYVHYFGFKSNKEATAEQQANKFYDWLCNKGVCELVTSRPTEPRELNHRPLTKEGEKVLSDPGRLYEFGFEWEVKVWGLKPQALEALLNRDVEPIQPVIRPTVIPKPKLADIPVIKASQLPANNIVAKSINFAPGSKFVVINDSRGWYGREGEVVKIDNTTIWAVMENSPGGRVDFKLSQIKLTDLVTMEEWVSIGQKMYDIVKGKGERLVNKILESIDSRGLQVVNDVVDVRF